MKNFLTLFIAGAGLIVASQAYVVNLYENQDCTGSVTSRNVWDNTCAYMIGFQSLELTTNEGDWQQLTAYSRQACAGPETMHACAGGALPLNVCFNTVDSNGGSNALSSYSSDNCF